MILRFWYIYKSKGLICRQKDRNSFFNAFFTISVMTRHDDELMLKGNRKRLSRRHVTKIFRSWLAQWRSFPVVCDASFPCSPQCQHHDNKSSTPEGPSKPTNPSFKRRFRYIRSIKRLHRWFLPIRAFNSNQKPSKLCHPN